MCRIMESCLSWDSAEAQVAVLASCIISVEEHSQKEMNSIPKSKPKIGGLDHRTPDTTPNSPRLAEVCLDNPVLEKWIINRPEKNSKQQNIQGH